MQGLKLSSSPHIRKNLDTSQIMRHVFFALLPAAIAGAIFTGPLRTQGIAAWQPALVILFSIASAMITEILTNRMLGKKGTLRDGSSMVTGLLLAMNLPPMVPLWIPVLGSAFAIAIAKQCFGGLGRNFINPALAGRAFLLASWPTIMTDFSPMVAPVQGVDALASATNLVAAKSSLADAFTHWSSVGLKLDWQLLIGQTNGCIGEIPRLLLIIGGVYLMARRIVSWRIPVIYIGSFVLFNILFGSRAPVDFQILSGGLILGAFFMATDYVSSPQTAKGQIIFALGCGLFTAVIRTWGGYPEGVSYAILIMNCLAPLITRMTLPKPFGEVKTNA